MFSTYLLILATVTLESPILLTIAVVFLSLNLSFVASTMVSKWLFISVFMVFLGGMMVLFFYMLSLSKPYKTRPLSLFLLTLIILSTMETTALLNKEDNILVEIFSPMSAQLIAYLSLILFFILILTTKICENFKGSLTSMW